MLWRLAQLFALLATVALLAQLVAAPSTGLTLLWDVAIPVLPATFLIHPGIWRNICPLATLSMLPNQPGGRILRNGQVPLAGVVGIGLLVLMVPARRFLFNTDATALAFTIVGVALLAMVLGALYDKKAGFCSSICPVLPVERLYGQAPLIAVGNPRCRPCTLCVTRACPDVAGTKATAQLLGSSRKSHEWLATGFGLFAAGFPGFVVGYNLIADGPMASAGTVYATVLASVLISYVATHLIVRTLHLGSGTALRALAALSLGLYYWFAAATITTHLAMPDWTPALIRSLALVLLLVWLAPRRRTVLV